MRLHLETPISAACCVVAAVACLCVTPAPAGAASVQVSVRVSAIDIGLASVINTDGGEAGVYQGTPPVAAYAVQGSTGIVWSRAAMAADGLSGRIGGSLVSTVGDTMPRAGRGGSATSVASMVGSIVLSGPAPGMATFTGLLEGAYNFGTADARFNNSGGIEGYGLIGDVYRDIGRIDFDPLTGAGLFGVPLSWTVPVLPGQRLDMQFDLRSTRSTVVGISAIDFSNTFKLTSIALPAGYTYAPDAQGFLSTFVPSAVPEPAPAALLLAGLGGVAFAVRRRCHA